MKLVYLDNAATTPLDPEVFEAMKPFMLEHFGNPSSTHAYGREVKAAIESSRKNIAQMMNCVPGEIIFTSGGTEADNTLIRGYVETYGIKNIISSPIEHHAVLHTLEMLEQRNIAQVHFVKLDELGHIDYDDLESLLQRFPGSLVALMQANNEIGNLLDIERVGELCLRFDAIFQSDTVQAVAHYRHNLKDLKIHGLTASAHKFHGPKGIGFMYVRKDKKNNPLILGGLQERGMRGGTEFSYGIMGIAKAMELAYRYMDEHKIYIQELKSRMIDGLKKGIPNLAFHGDSENLNRSLYTVLNVSLPESDKNDMLLFNLDLAGVSASGGSACASGATQGSHVLKALNPESKRGAVRFSFSKYTTANDVDFATKKLTEILTLKLPAPVIA
ncbi:MAG: cysteine desulfurase [Flammeovirgaceae bacterium]|nr:cysteine desulfurase [Flammeovirgaceae bacterium]